VQLALEASSIGPRPVIVRILLTPLKFEVRKQLLNEVCHRDTVRIMAKKMCDAQGKWTHTLTNFILGGGRNSKTRADVQPSVLEEATTAAPKKRGRGQR
jgi:hypothetical protein